MEVPQTIPGQISSGSSRPIINALNAFLVKSNEGGGGVDEKQINSVLAVWTGIVRL